MATLTQTAYFTRRALAVGIIALLGYIVLKISFGIAKNIWLTLNPPPPPPPTVAFGKLPPLVFPKPTNMPLPKAKLNYRLEAIGGGLPSLPNIGKVYFIPIGKPNLLALERADQKAKKMGFPSQPEAVTETTYYWTTLDTPQTTIEMDIYTGNFHFRYPYETDQQLLVNKNLPDNKQAAELIKNFLRNNNLLGSEFDKERFEYSFWSLTPAGLTPAISLSEADFIRVDIFRVDLDEMRILTPNPEKSLINFLLSGSKDLRKKIVEVNFTRYPIETESFSTYPLKSVTAAWQELQGEKGYIASLGQNKDGQITVRQVFLAYYESLAAQNYLQPIYVFAGDNGFFAYVPAIAPEWME